MAMPARDRRNVSTGSPYEPLLGISRGVRAGQFIAISGTAPIGPDGKNVGKGDVEAQARRCFEIIGEALTKAGSRLEDVIRTRVLLTDISDWAKVGKVHAEFFGTIRPANTTFQIARFIDPEWLVEVEVDAVAE
jgi:enamine deaminase RidA (YjgF/YER057c/UK114 family)